jgi:hypothetical protein
MKKVPSAISYSASKEMKQWGSSIAPHSIVFTWTKLELMPQSPAHELLILRKLLEGLPELQMLEQSVPSSRQVPRHLAKTASEVIEDFLQRIAGEWYKFMSAKAKTNLAENVLDVIVTFPVVMFLAISIWFN